jgi:DNA-binding transcriptional MerR regulator
MARPPAKGEGAFRTIRELSDELGVPQHVLRYWEQRFPQLRPLQRAGNRRYYRPDDVALAKRIRNLLNEEGYTVKGVQRLLAGKAAAAPAPAPAAAAAASPPSPPSAPSTKRAAVESIDREAIARVRDRLAQALIRD